MNRHPRLPGCGQATADEYSGSQRSPPVGMRIARPSFTSRFLIGIPSPGGCRQATDDEYNGSDCFFPAEMRMPRQASSRSQICVAQPAMLDLEATSLVSEAVVKQLTASTVAQIAFFPAEMRMARQSSPRSKVCVAQPVI